MFITSILNANSFNVESKITANPGIISIETGLTITKVRTAQNKGKSYVIASSYEGTVIGVSYKGKVLWKNKLSGFMNHDVWCEDITGNGKDEILVANADGILYCLNAKGKLLWTFKTAHKNAPPMYAVTVIKNGKTPIVVCGGFDKSFYYVSEPSLFVSFPKKLMVCSFVFGEPFPQRFNVE